MPTNLDPVKCKACAKMLAIVTADGIVPTSIAGGCDTCQEFRSLYDAMQGADQEYATYIERRDDYVPKQEAFSKLKKTNLKFNNWLLSVEAFIPGTQDALPGTQAEVEGTAAEQNVGERGMKRARSSSPPAATRSETSSVEGHRGTEVVHKRRCLTFADEVEFREDYRPSSFFSRSDAAYSRGRYAPPKDSEYLDTSGSTTTYLKFSGMKKVGKLWVEVNMENEENKIKKGRKRGMLAETTDAAPSIGDEPGTTEDTQKNARAKRLARRKNATSTASTMQQQVTVRSKNSRAGSKSTPLDLDKNKARQPLGTSTTVHRNGASKTAHPEQIAVDHEDKEDAKSKSGVARIGLAQDVHDHLQPSNVSEGLSSLVADPVNHELDRHGDNIDKQVHVTPENEEENLTEENRKHESAQAASRYPDGRNDDSFRTPIKYTDSKHALVVRHEQGSTTVDDQDPAASKDTMGSPPEEERKDAVHEILRNTEISARNDPLDLHATHQQLEGTAQDLKTLLMSPKKPGVEKLELPDITSAAAISPAQTAVLSLNNNPSPDVLLADFTTPDPASSPNHAQHPVADPASSPPAVSATLTILDPRLDGSG